MQFQVHDVESAPAGAKAILEKIQQSYGFLPNLAGVFAESPATLAGLIGFIAAFDAKEMTLSPVERQVVLLAVSVKNHCEYCAAAHGMLAHKVGLNLDEVENLQQGRTLSDAKLEALRSFAQTLTNARGWVPESELEKFIGQGFTKAQILEVVFGVALKTLTNYANHIAKPPLNEQLAGFAPKWH